MLEIIALAIYASEVAIVAIILYFVVSLLPMPANMKLVVQALIILVCILSVLGRVVSPSAPASSLVPPRPLSPTSPSIVR